ncbi:serine/threonine protein kinase [Lysobacter daejeonensis GH1-9]|uniref:non-specific serine/threonine protein kinase n=1 Tax=Lysobacter daejeonensis GH1-9 TaxID=1385517 RepID=A0A0A0F3K3_9GAMM|nr:serine/threonine-protein kinase [Lysobacter daejeonensis]KGM55982.1 serine/threonine protein kinase [Lysobacter daejeonensis GH1-9]
MTDPAQPTATSIQTSQHLSPGTLLAGRFRIEAMLGIGGMGVVYRATDTALDVPVALKLLRPELASRSDAFERFRQELLMARQVSSPRVVRIHDLAQHDGQWMISMDYVDGEGLDHLIDREGPLPVDRAIHIARQLSEGLSAAHARGVIHRDLKPANVLVDRAGDAYISDFGVARSLASQGLTQTGAVVGTPDYLSPEQARGEAVDARSDLYALGLILYEMLTGRMPFAGATVSEALAQRMVRAPAPVTRHRPDTPPWLVRLVDRLLRPQPAHRLQCADDVIRAIDRREVPREWRWGRAGWLTLAALLAVALGGVAIWQWQQRPAPGGVATIAPLHRLLVLPVTSPDGSLDAAQRTALAALLRQSLASAPGVAVVDEDRTQQALRQLDPSGTARLDAPGLQRIVGADRTLQIDVSTHGTQWQASARLERPGGAPLHAKATGGNAARAVQALLTGGALKPVLGASLPLGATDDTQALALYGTGLTAWQRGNPADALTQLREATQRAPGFTAAWMAQAEVAQLIGEQDVAYDAIERGQASMGNAPAAMMQRLKADRAMLDGDAPAAAAVWRARLQSTPDDTFAELQWARALGGGGDFKAATERLQRLTARDPNDPRAWFELGKFSILHGDARRAVEDYLVRALVLYKRSGNRYGEGETVNAMGIGYARLGQHADAEEQYRKAVELRRSVGNRRGLATSLRNLGSALSQRGEFAEATTFLQQARSLHESLGDRGGLAAVEQELGLLAEERGDYPAALAAFRRALQTWQQVGDPRGTAMVLNDIGFAHFQLGNYDDAQAYLAQSATASTTLGDDTGRIRAQQNQGLVAMARGQWPGALKLFEQTRDAAEAQQMLEEAAVSYRNLTELSLLQGHVDDALSQADKAAALFRQRDDDRGLLDVGLLRAQALLAAHADTDAGRALEGLSKQIAAASTEQRAIADLLRAELAHRRGDQNAEAEALQDATQLAKASGVRSLILQAALQGARHAPLAASLASNTATLGHLPLRLHWSRIAMQQALDGQQPARAAAIYRDVVPMLRKGDHLDAAALHTMGATALSATGDANAAASASRSAQAAWSVRSRHIPPPLRAAFDNTIRKAFPLAPTAEPPHG